MLCMTETTSKLAARFIQTGFRHAEHDLQTHEITHGIPDFYDPRANGFSEHHAAGRSGGNQKQSSRGTVPCERDAHYGIRLYQRRRTRPARRLQKVARRIGTVRSLASEIQAQSHW